MKSIYSILFITIFYQFTFSQSLKKINQNLKIELAQKVVVFDSLNLKVFRYQQKYDTLSYEVVDNCKNALKEKYLNEMLIDFLKLNTQIVSNRFGLEIDNSSSLKKTENLQGLYADEKIKIDDSLLQKKNIKIDIPHNLSNEAKIKAKIENKILLKRIHEYDSLILFQKNTIVQLEKVNGRLQDLSIYFKSIYFDFFALNINMKQELDAIAAQGFKASEIKKKQLTERIKKIKDQNNKTKVNKNKVILFSEPLISSDDENYLTNDLVTTTSKTFRDRVYYIMYEMRTEYIELKEEKLSNIDLIDEDAQFPGGEIELMKFIYCNLSLETINSTENKKVYVGFTIDKNGIINDVEMLRPTSENLGKEAMRIISLIPNFTPAKQNGKPVKIKYRLSIIFDKETKERYCR